MNNHWHVHLSKSLKEPVWAYAREHQMGLVETMEALLKFALARPEALAFYRDREKTRVQQATIVQNTFLMDPLKARKQP